MSSRSRADYVERVSSKCRADVEQMSSKCRASVEQVSSRCRASVEQLSGQCRASGEQMAGGRRPGGALGWLVGCGTLRTGAARAWQRAAGRRTSTVAHTRRRSTQRMHAHGAACSARAADGSACARPCPCVLCVPVRVAMRASAGPVQDVRAACVRSASQRAPELFGFQCPLRGGQSHLCFFAPAAPSPAPWPLPRTSLRRRPVRRPVWRPVLRPVPRAPSRC